jgi:hypothetical protein
MAAHDTLGRLPLRFCRRLLHRGLLRRLPACDRHEHFLLTACDLAWLFGRLGLSIGAARFMVREQTVRVARDETLSLVVLDDKTMLDGP